jgi:hypothetical protein
MTSEELARVCFAARPVLWAIAIIAILFAAAFLIPKIMGRNSENGDLQNF